jgi:hypothetical protein
LSGIRFSLFRKTNDYVMAKYSKKAEKTITSAMRRRKKGTLKSGSGRKVTNPKQAIAIGISEARKKGAKVPPKKKASAGRPPVKRRKTAAKKTRKKTRS